MSGRISKDARHAFGRSRYVWVRVTPAGFVIDDQLLDELCGHIAKTHLIRKRFEDGALVCDSKDGKRARDDTVCADCLHPNCRPQIRVQLSTDNDVVFVVDLPGNSARNLVALEASADLDRDRLKLTVVDRGPWGEVRFEVL